MHLFVISSMSALLITGGKRSALVLFPTMPLANVAVMLIVLRAVVIVGRLAVLLVVVALLVVFLLGELLVGEGLLALFIRLGGLRVDVTVV